VTVSNERQFDYWEGLDKRRRSDHPAVRAFAEPKLGALMRAIGVEAGAYSMVEVGAGSGHFSLAFERAFDLTCVDYSGNMLTRNPAHARKIVADAMHLPFAAGAFDVAFCGNLLHHLEDPHAAVAELKRVARKHVVLLEPNCANPVMRAFCWLKKEERGALKFSRTYLRELGQAAGVKTRLVQSLGMVLPNATPAALVPLIRAIDAPNPMGFYCLGVFDVADGAG
jgi:SAM-dependent methyltransferase